MRRFAAACLLAALTPLNIIGSPGDIAVGTFHRNLRGVSAFIGDGTNVTVYGAYRGLRPGGSYFTVIYGNGNCDPAQAFPVGPFTTDDRGRATLAASVAQPAQVDVGNTRSISVRRGDNDTDIDGDGITGPTDVVAVAGQPQIGLVQCEYSPAVRNFS